MMGRIAPNQRVVWVIQLWISILCWLQVFPCHLIWFIDQEDVLNRCATAFWFRLWLGGTVNGAEAVSPRLPPPLPTNLQPPSHECNKWAPNGRFMGSKRPCNPAQLASVLRGGKKRKKFVPDWHEWVPLWKCQPFSSPIHTCQELLLCKYTHTYSYLHTLLAYPSIRPSLDNWYGNKRQIKSRDQDHIVGSMYLRPPTSHGECSALFLIFFHGTI